MRKLLNKFGIKPTKIYLNSLECKSELKCLKNKSGRIILIMNII